MKRVIQKIRRELSKPLSKLCVKSAKINYLGMQLKVPLVYGLGADYLVPGNIWMSKCLSVFLEYKQGVVVDIGVNVGLYMVKLRALDRYRAYIGFEPNPMCNFYTQELISANNFENVRIFPIALSEKRELRKFYTLRKGDKMGSLHDYARFGQKGKFTFDLLTFSGDEFVELMKLDKICVFKIDAEGAELEVLRGLARTIGKYRPYIFCEIWKLPQHDHPTYQEKNERLQRWSDVLVTSIAPTCILNFIN